MKKYARNNNFRNVKTDKHDSVTIANYGIEKWFKLQKYECSGMEYEELKLLGRRYWHYMEMHVAALQELTHLHKNLHAHLKCPVKRLLVPSLTRNGRGEILTGAAKNNAACHNF